ncbi:nitrous oxide reductase accessory protein NosL [Novispirillum sp. DQ9]|uniref:nitrous oxide reductase accessory protein NosL n=1 Tax=Novispirillum sp. DQ9 TaxID=3398612 RepID=UPI003C7DF2C4
MRRLLLSLGLVALLAACGEEQQAAAPPPAPLSRDATGHYCHMLLTDHDGPKGQIHVAGRQEPVWFTSVRDTFAFTMLPEEAKDIRAIYVTDMGRAASWEQPGDASWMDARKAHYVLGSTRRGGMGQREAVPFSDPEAARAFAAEHGGTVVAFDAVPKDYILAQSEDPPAAHGH